jgi:hypothetical protein
MAAMIPAVPSRAAAPAETAAEGIAAPVEARSTPAVVIPAIIAAAEEELDLLHIVIRRD